MRRRTSHRATWCVWTLGALSAAGCAAAGGGAYEPPDPGAAAVWLPFQGTVDVRDGRAYLVTNDGAHLEMAASDVRSTGSRVQVLRGASVSEGRTDAKAAGDEPSAPAKDGSRGPRPRIAYGDVGPGPSSALSSRVTSSTSSSSGGACGQALPPQGGCSGCGICYGAVHYCCSDHTFVGVCPSLSAVWSSATCPE